MKLDVPSARVYVRSGFRTDGSVLAGTVQASPAAFETRLELQSEEPPDRLATLVRNAEAGCFAMQMLEHRVEMSRQVSLNGAPFDVSES